MSCQRCPRLRVELQRTQNNVRLIEDLLEDAKNRDKNLQDTLDRLAMLHKHCRTNYKDMANLTFALNHCQNQPRCPRLWMEPNKKANHNPPTQEGHAFDGLILRRSHRWPPPTQPMFFLDGSILYLYVITIWSVFMYHICCKMCVYRWWLIYYGHQQNLINLLKRSDLHWGKLKS